MAGGFRVDLGALEQAAAGVSGVLADVGQQTVSDMPHDGSVIGHAGLASTLSDFLDRWNRGVDNLASDGQQIAARLTANMNAYRTVEQNLRDHITRVNGELAGSGADPGVR